MLDGASPLNPPLLHTRGTPSVRTHFLPLFARLTFYPDLAKPASLASPPFVWELPSVGGQKAPLPNASPSPLTLTPALKLLQISKNWAASDEQQ